MTAVKRPSICIRLWADDSDRTCLMADPCHPTVVEASRAARYSLSPLSVPERLTLADVQDSFEYLCSEEITTKAAVERLRMMRREIKRRNAQEVEP